MAEKQTRRAKPRMEVRKIADLVQDDHNANKGTERGAAMLDDSLETSKLGRGVVVDKNGKLIGGNKTTAAALAQGFEDAVIVHTTGDKLIVNMRDDLDLDDEDPNNQARQMAYYDNRVGQVDLEWNAAQLFADKKAGLDLGKLFNEGELSLMLAKANGEKTGKSGKSLLGALEYKIVVSCENEFHQIELIQKFEAEGLPCQALIS